MKPNILKTTILAALFLAVLSFSADAQSPAVSINVENVSLKTLLKAIEAESGYTFAYVDSELGDRKGITLKAEGRSVASIIAEILPEMDMAVKDRKIILTLKPQKPQVASSVKDDVPLRTITGKVVDQNGEPVTGAMVILAGTTQGTATDFDGRYSLAIKKNEAVLEFSSIGYRSATVSLNDYQVIADVVMREESILLDDVVVVGYGVQNRRDVTTSIVSMKSDDFKAMPTADFRDAMAAKMPGVQITTLGGQPDGNVAVRIRGVQSATSGNDPLYVIDGVPSDSRAFANIDASEIESLEVLKDASAAAIYGSRGSCGVIIITTKRGSSEQPVISYDGQFSVANVSKKIDLLDAYEFAQLMKESRDGVYLLENPNGSIGDPYDIRGNSYCKMDPYFEPYLTDRTGTLTDTDWQDEIFRTALSHRHSVSVSGKTKNLKYFVGANYLNREGTIIGSEFERYGIRVNIDGERKRFSYGVSLAPSYSKTRHVNAQGNFNAEDGLVSGVVSAALMTAPNFPVYKDGSYCWDMNGLVNVGIYGNTQLNATLNPVAVALEIDDIRQKMNLTGNAYAAYEFFKGFSYKLTIGGDVYNYVRDYYRPSSIPHRGQAYLDEPFYSIAQSNNDSYFHWIISNQLSFNRKFGDHSINAVAAYEAEKQTIKTSQIYGQGDIGDDSIRTTKGKTIIPDETYNNSYGYTFASWLVRAQYSYKGRYMVSASIRGDASSRFAPDTRWGYFPAASVGWRLSDEGFMDGADWLNDLKLRASVGQTGNAQIGNSEYLALYKVDNSTVGNSLTSMVYPSQIANNALGWEKNTQYNIGVDLSAWNGLLGFNADLYYSKTTDMLFDVPVPSVSGHTTSKVNIGSMQNKGVELIISSNRRIGDFSYSVSANWSLNRNKVLSLGDEDTPIIKEADFEGAYYITQVGQPIGCYYLLVRDGIFLNDDELAAYPHFDGAQVGDYRFVDVDGDGVMEEDEDRAIVGNYAPDFYYGLSLQLGYKGFDFMASLQGVYGNEVLNLQKRYLCSNSGSQNMSSESLERFPYGNLTSRANRKGSGNTTDCSSTFHLEDGSYLRLQNVSLGYTFPKKWFGKARISSLRLYVQGSNLLTFTNYTGYNPEISNNSNDALRPGDGYWSYPLPRTFTVGLSFNL